MTFRWRLLLVFLAAVLLPMIVLALFIREEVTDRLTAQYTSRVESLVRVIEGDFADESEAVDRSLALVRDGLMEDNRFRRAAVDGVQEERRYLLDYAGHAMRLAGLSMLQIQDETGRILSSGHFRNDYDRMEPQLPRLLASTANGTALVQARGPESSFLALARVDSFRVGNREFTIVGGSEVEKRFLERLGRNAGMTVTLVYPGGVLGGPSDEGSGVAKDSGVGRGRGEIVRELGVPFIDSQHGEAARAEFRVTHDLAELRLLRRSIDRWFLFAVAAAVLFAVTLASWLASRMSRPLVELADKTSRIDLDRLDIDFESRGRDEIGVLSRVLGAMTDKLRASAVQIKDAERRATVGELARQVNHDIKNGLIPIRNVFRHLSELAREHPDELPKVFEERQGTVDSSISYLEKLASNYGRLSVRGESRPCDVNEIVRQVVTDRQVPGSVRIHTTLCDRAVVLADPLSLRRVLENLADNAIDSLGERPGSVTIETVLVPLETGSSRVRVIVSDTGIGMSDERMARIFDDFYTTKPNGTGLGLSIVRRLVMDLGGSIHVESKEGEGSRFIMELPGEG
jgi:signal transduction histidine kinase